MSIGPVLWQNGFSFCLVNTFMLIKMHVHRQHFQIFQDRKDCQAVTFQSAARSLFTCLCNASNLLYLTWREGLWPQFAGEAGGVLQRAGMTQPQLSVVHLGFLCCRQGKVSARGMRSLGPGVLLCTCVVRIPVRVLKVCAHEGTVI